MAGSLVHMFTAFFPKFCHLWSCVRPEKEFGRLFDLRVWSCVRPENESGRVFHLKESGRLFDLKRVWSCVPPEKEFGRAFDLKKSLVVCST